MRHIRKAVAWQLPGTIADSPHILAAFPVTTSHASWSVCDVKGNLNNDKRCSPRWAGEMGMLRNGKAENGAEWPRKVVAKMPIAGLFHWCTFNLLLFTFADPVIYLALGRRLQAARFILRSSRNPLVNKSISRPELKASHSAPWKRRD